MKARSKIELKFENVDYTANPYNLVVKLVDARLEGDPATDYSKILPLLDKDKHGKRLLLEAITRNAKEFYELIKNDISNDKLNWNEKTNLLAYLMSAQRRVKSVKPFGSTKSSVELQRIVGAMHLLRDAMGQLEDLNQPQSLYGRKIEKSHRGKPYLERAKLYINLGYLLRAQLDLEIARQYKKCDQRRLVELTLALMRKMSSTSGPEVLPVVGRPNLNLSVSEEDEGSRLEEISARSRSSSLSVVDDGSVVSAHEPDRDTAFLSDKEPQSNLDDKPDPLSEIDYRYDGKEVGRGSGVSPVVQLPNNQTFRFVNNGAGEDEIPKLADELEFDRALKALKCEFMNNQSEDSCDFTPLRAMIIQLERSDYPSSVVNNEMLVSGVLRLAPVVSSEEDEYPPGSLMGFLSGENHLMDLAAHYGVINLLRLIKALPALSRSELAERCLDSEDAVGKQFVQNDKDDESIVAIKNDFLEKIRLAYKHEGEHSKPWNKPGLFSDENLPELFQKSRLGALMRLKPSSSNRSFSKVGSK